MTEEILKIKAGELQLLRFVYGTGEAHEVPRENAVHYAKEGRNPDIIRHVSALVDALTFFSHPNADPHLEFVIPVRRQ
jgi:hypothetical protein